MAIYSALAPAGASLAPPCPCDSSHPHTDPGGAVSGPADASKVVKDSQRLAAPFNLLKSYFGKAGERRVVIRS